MALRARFVDSIASSPTVRLDLNDGVTWRVRKEGTALPPPDLKRVYAESMLVDGSRVTADAFENREIKLSLRVAAADADTAFAEVQKLSRELDRRDNLLEWRPNGATTSVFFRTKRSPLGDTTDVLRTLKWAEVVILAEPFALGLRETLASATVNNDPASGTNPMGFTVSSPKGDRQTPLILTITASGVIATGRRKSVIAVRRGGTPSNVPFALQAEAMTQVTNTTTQSNDANYSGSGSNSSLTTFGTPTLVNRLTFSGFPGTSSTDLAGSFRVYVRGNKTVAGDDVDLQFGVNCDGQEILGPVVSPPADTNRRWIDLCGNEWLLQLPMGENPGASADGVPYSIRSIDVLLKAARNSGSGNWRTDCFLFVPADDRLAEIKWPEASGPDRFVVDGWTDSIIALDSSGAQRSTGIVNRDGGLPMLSPGVTNRIYFLLDAGTTSAGDTKTNTVSIVPSYFPVYDRVAPA